MVLATNSLTNSGSSGSSSGVALRPSRGGSSSLRRGTSSANTTSNANHSHHNGNSAINNQNDSGSESDVSSPGESEGKFINIFYTFMLTILHLF